MDSLTVRAATSSQQVLQPNRAISPFAVPDLYRSALKALHCRQFVFLAPSPELAKRLAAKPTLKVMKYNLSRRKKRASTKLQ
mmetsp:Transcript_50727/g.95076  ORF Transcript_50727/g.95076 Transcript_50727/m.95076 type:complete len:82 (+) Transcript_50727:1262-1507(+)